MQKFIPVDKPDIKKQLEKTVVLNQVQKDFLHKLTPQEASDIFFAILNNPKNVSVISKKSAAMGFSENNIIFEGESNPHTPGDQISVSRWAKAASGALIIPMRYNDHGELEILFGKKRGMELWVLPGGHYELDDHKNLDHTFVAELMEETGIIPYNDKFANYINLTLEHAADILPYKSVEEAGDNFISKRFSTHLETVLSGGDLGYKKRIVIAVYSILFHDGMQLHPQASDDIEFLKWFNVHEILAGDAELKFSLSHLNSANYQAVEHVFLRMGIL